MDSKIKAEPAYVDWVWRKMADAVTLAVRRLQPAEIGFATAQESRISFVRRYRMRQGWVAMNPGVGNPDIVEPVGKTDPEIGILAVRDLTGNLLAVLANFSLHYVGTDQGNEISADYYGHFAREMQRILGKDVVPILMNGASGNVNNVRVTRPWPHRGHAQAVRMAKVLAGHVLTELQLMAFTRAAVVRAADTTFRFTRKTITEADRRVAERILAGNYAYAEGPFSWVRGQPIPERIVDVYAREQGELAEWPLELTAPLQAFRVGSAGLVALPGEIFAEIGLAIKARSPFHPQFIASLANDHIGYVPTEEAFQEGGYETWMCRAALPAPGTAPHMEEEAVRLLASLAD